MSRDAQHFLRGDQRCVCCGLGSEAPGVDDPRLVLFGWIGSPSSHQEQGNQRSNSQQDELWVVGESPALKDHAVYSRAHFRAEHRGRKHLSVFPSTVDAVLLARVEGSRQHDNAGSAKIHGASGNAIGQINSLGENGTRRTERGNCGRTPEVLLRRDERSRVVDN
jgi:hypothetical protein